MTSGPASLDDLPRSLAILASVARDLGYRIDIPDRFSGHLLRVRDPRGGACFHSGTGVLPAFGGNDMVLGAVCRDKAFCYQLLESDGFAVPEGGHFFLTEDKRDQRPMGREVADACRFAVALSGNFERPLVVKPNSGARAQHVHLAHDAASLQRHMRAIAEHDPVCLLQAYIEAPEFRLFLVGGEVGFCYAKSRPAVVGDGVAPLAKLIERSNKNVDRDFLDMTLCRGGRSLDSVPDAGERLELGFVANISSVGSFGGFVEVSEAVAAWARRLHRSIPLEVMGVDVFSASQLADPDDLVVIDVNGSPGLATLYDLGHRELVRDVWRTILERYFAQGSV